MLSLEQKEMRVNMSKDLMADENVSFLKKILTANETGGFLDNLLTKRHSSVGKGEATLGQKPRKNGTKQLKGLSK
ncbi:hypothetical protein TNCV_4786131 [Trichonephila clavipes]|nr:hypothetical protein TNCV_4786131 [Trichonephila clavipes]